MLPIAVFLLSIGLQFAAAIYALLLIRITGKKSAWILISIAMVLMTSRRIVSFISILTTGKKFTLEIPELIAFVVACLMLLGVLRIRRYFQSINLALIERQEAEKAVRQLHRKYEELINSIDGIVWEADARTFQFSFVSKQAERLLGYPIERWLTEPAFWKDHIHPYDQEWAVDFCIKATKEKRSHNFEYRMIAADGCAVWVRNIVTVVVENDKPVKLQGVMVDITERNMLEDQLRQSQKMEALGTLTSGVAHDFNNILTAIIGYGNLLQMKINKDDPLKVYIDQILSSAERAVNLNQSLLAFSRKQIINPQPVKLNDIVRRAEKLLMRLIGEDIEFKTMMSEEITIFADSGQIEQVLMNLCTNARDAMPKGGLLTIETGSMRLDAEFIRTHGYGETGTYAVISVTDTGTGMDKTTVERIFEPFFTTKEMGRGTGLGLAIAYGIVKQHNGYINVYSEPDSGTTFRIYLPVFEPHSDIPVRLPETSDSVEITGGTETVFLAEDDPDVRGFTKELLTEYGYKVVEAADGEDAVLRFAENRDSIRLVILDVVMPKKNGREVYNEILKTAPDMKALFMSGYASSYIQKKGIIDEGLNFMHKPVSPADFLKKVRELLDKKS